MIYFIEASYAKTKFIKIGYSANPKTRLRNLQSSCPLPLKLLGCRPGNEADEHSLHFQFRRHRVRGEWFRPHQDLLATIQATT